MKSLSWQDDHGKTWQDWLEEALVLEPFRNNQKPPLTYDDVLITTKCVQKEIEELGYTLAEYTELLYDAYIVCYDTYKQALETTKQVVFFDTLK